MVHPPIPRSAFTCIATRCCIACGGSRRSEGCGSKTQRRGSTCSSACASARFCPPRRAGRRREVAEGGARRLGRSVCAKRTRRRCQSCGGARIEAAPRSLLGLVHEPTLRRTPLHRRSRTRIAIAGATALATLPLTAHAADSTATQAAGVAADTVWVVVAALLVLFMQAGFAMLEVGFTRMKNVGTVVAKVIVNLSISSVMYWLVGFAFAFGAASGFVNSIIGVTGFAPSFHPGSTMNLPSLAASTAPAAAKFFFEFVFCAVSLAIVWGTMLERTRFIVYILFAVPFAGFIYPMISHWLFGGGEDVDDEPGAFEHGS